MASRETFFCSLCYHHLAVGSWQNGEWVCFWCNLKFGLSHNHQENQPIKYGTTKYNVEIEEILELDKF